MTDGFDASLDLLRRLDPKKVSQNIQNLCKLEPALAEELLSSVDTPLSVQKCPVSGKNYLCCDYNRDGDSYRSPWSNKYNPTLDDEDEAPHPSSYLRQLEISANDSFDIYRDLYYEGGISSVYLWDTEDDDVDETGKIAFAGVALLKKKNDRTGSKNSGCWDSIHVFEVEPSAGGGVANYKVTSTVILDLDNTDSSTTMSLSGNLTRQTEREASYNDASDHVANIGSLVEDTESKLRNMLQEVYFGKTKDVVGDLRSTESLGSKKESRARQEELIESFERL